MWRGFFGEGIIKDVVQRYINPLKSENNTLRQELEATKAQLEKIKNELSNINTNINK